VRIRGDLGDVITGFRLCRHTHVGRLLSSSGQLLAQATFANESATVWQQVTFATPVAIQANTIYMMSYHAKVGRFAYDESHFGSAYTRGPLRALSRTEVGGNGVYDKGAGGASPPAPTARRTIGAMCSSRPPEPQPRAPKGRSGRPYDDLRPLATDSKKKSRRQVGPLHDRSAQVAVRPSPTPRTRG